MDAVAQNPTPGAALTPAAEQFLANLRSPATRRTYRSDLRAYSRFLAGRGLGLGEGGFDEALAYKGQMEARAGADPGGDAGGMRGGPTKKLADDTVARRLAAACSFYGFLVARKAREDNPFLEVSRPPVDSGDGKTPAPSRAEVEHLLWSIGTTEVADKRDSLIVFFLFGAGARLSEVAPLRLDRVVFEKDHAKVRVRLKGRRAATWIGIPPPVTRLLRAYTRAARIGSGYIFRPRPRNMRYYIGRSIDGGGQDFRQKHISARALQKMLARRARTAGLPTDRFHPHCGRVFAITDAARRGVGLERIRRDVGHRSINSTLRYQRLADDVTEQIGYTANLQPRPRKTK